MKTCKIPKQLSKWLKSAGLEYEFADKSLQNRVYFTGYGRYFRLNENNIEVSCLISEFRNWDFDCVETVPIPYSENEFIHAIKHLVHEAEQPQELVNHG